MTVYYVAHRSGALWRVVERPSPRQCARDASLSEDAFVTALRPPAGLRPHDPDPCASCRSTFSNSDCTRYWRIGWPRGVRSIRSRRSLSRRCRASSRSRCCRARSSARRWRSASIAARLRSALANGSRGRTLRPPPRASRAAAAVAVSGTSPASPSLSPTCRRSCRAYLARRHCARCCRPCRALRMRRSRSAPCRPCRFQTDSSRTTGTWDACFGSGAISSSPVSIAVPTSSLGLSLRPMTSSERVSSGATPECERATHPRAHTRRRSARAFRPRLPRGVPRSASCTVADK